MSSLPYISSPGNIEKALKGIKAAAVPERVSQDFVKTVLKIPGGSGDQMTTYLRKLNFARSDGTPTETYTKFRNPTTSGQALAASIRHAYARLYVRNEFMHKLPESDLQGLIVEETGQAQDSLSVKRMLGCILTLRKDADFGIAQEIRDSTQDIHSETTPKRHQDYAPTPERPTIGSVGLNLGYTININLPATTDQAVFNAIFKNLKENLLRDDDA